MTEVEVRVAHARARFHFVSHMELSEALQAFPQGSNDAPFQVSTKLSASRDHHVVSGPE